MPQSSVSRRMPSTSCGRQRRNRPREIAPDTVSGQIPVRQGQDNSARLDTMRRRIRGARAARPARSLGSLAGGWPLSAAGSARAGLGARAAAARSLQSAAAARNAEPARARRARRRSSSRRRRTPSASLPSSWWTSPRSTVRRWAPRASIVAAAAGSRTLIRRRAGRERC